MILNTGQRTDIPAFYSEWFYRRVQEQEVYVRNPYRPELVTRYRIDPTVVDLLCFCTKNPSPMLPRLRELSAFPMLWHVTATPYGKDIEPRVPPFETVLSAVKELSDTLGSITGTPGKRAVFLRYDPILLNDVYTKALHLKSFEAACDALEDKCEHIIISFIDLYQKTRRNFPDVREVSKEDQFFLAERFAKIAGNHGMRVIGCAEDPALARFGIDTAGCMTKKTVETLLCETLKIPAADGKARDACDCLLGHDIGAYNTCPHGCKYCYANFDTATVNANRKQHDPFSPLLIGHLTKDDIIRDAVQQKYGSGQLRLSDFGLSV